MVCTLGRLVYVELVEEMAGFEGVPLMSSFVVSHGASVQ